MHNIEIQKLRPEIRQDWAGLRYEETDLEASVWPFEIRASDEESFSAMIMDKTFDRVGFVSLGAVGCTSPSIRSIAAIAEMAHVQSVAMTHRLGEPQPLLFYPVHLNAWANGVDAERNLEMARVHFEIAQSMYRNFYPELLEPAAIIDAPEGVSWIDEVSQIALSSISVGSRQDLISMASKHSQLPDEDEIARRSIGYLIGHYVFYGWLPKTEYVDMKQYSSMPSSDKHRDGSAVERYMYIVPQSEDRFHSSIELEFDAMRSAVGPSLIHHDHYHPSKRPIVAYSDHLRTAPYLLHNNEPRLSDFAQQWINGSLGTRGINGTAYREITSSIEYLKQRLDGDIHRLRKDVLYPHRGRLVAVQD